MKKIVFIALLFTQLSSFAQIEFKAELSRTKIGLNENVRINFTMNADGDNLQLPAFDNFRVISGPYQQMSTSIVNGKRSYSKSFGYTLQPTKKGTLTIGSASVTIDGKVYKTQPVQITITDPVQRPNDTSMPLIEVEDGIHLVAQVSKRNPYLNEPISILYKLYFKDGLEIRNFTTTDTEYNDFWSHNIEVKGYETKSETYKGESYSSVIIKKVVLYPQKPGRISISPLTIDLSLGVPSNRRDYFGRRVYNSTNTKVSTGTVTINVKPLPEEGRPEDFSGAVGTFSLVVTPNRTAVRQGETIELDVSVNGKGNLELFSLPKPIVPNALEMYDPLSKKKINVSLSGMQGNISDKYTIIPQYQGKYSIKSIHFSYFDLTTETYKTLSSQEIIIDMIDGPISEESEQNTTNQINLSTQNEISTADSFRFIALKTNLQPIQKPDFLFSKPFYFWLSLPLLLIPAIVLVKRKKEERDSDVEGNKIRSTNKLAKKYLSEAKRNQNDKQRFYESIERALHNFLKAKLKIETSEMSKEKISELLNDKRVGEETIKDFLSLIQTAEIVRYAPSLTSEMGADYHKAIETIIELEKKIK